MLLKLKTNDLTQKCSYSNNLNSWKKCLSKFPLIPAVGIFVHYSRPCVTWLPVCTTLRSLIRLIPTFLYFSCVSELLKIAKVTDVLVSSFPNMPRYFSLSFFHAIPIGSGKIATKTGFDCCNTSPLANQTNARQLIYITIYFRTITNGALDRTTKKKKKECLHYPHT